MVVSYKLVAVEQNLRSNHVGRRNGAIDCVCRDYHGRGRLSDVSFAANDRSAPEAAVSITAQYANPCLGCVARASRAFPQTFA
jgi:hypothetical protein